jgi:hypothetical protein
VQQPVAGRWTVPAGAVLGAAPRASLNAETKRRTRDQVVWQTLPFAMQVFPQARRWCSEATSSPR